MDGDEEQGTNTWWTVMKSRGLSTEPWWMVMKSRGLSREPW